MINYPFINLFCYPAGAGGKFLINCISLNDKVVFQDRKLTEKQLAGTFTTANKIKFLNDGLKLAQDSNVWTDLGLGDFQLTEMSNERYLDTFPEIIKKYFDRAHWIQECMSRQIHLNMVSHNFVDLELKRRVWANGKIIVFTNFRSFLEQRGYYIIDNLGFIATHEVTESRENIDKLWNHYTESLSEKFVFDVEYAYTSSANFYNTYLQVCDYLFLPTMSRLVIEKYFSTWIKVLESISQSSLQV